MDKIEKTEEQWREELTSEEYEILRQKGTERPFTGEYWNEHGRGMYKCRACGLELFSSDTKFDSGTGWPSFTDPVNRENVELKVDTSHGMSRFPFTEIEDPRFSEGESGQRVEVLCKRCGSHLGHVFDDGPTDRGRKRFCINSCAIKIEKAN